MKRILAMALALVIMLGGLYVAPTPAWAASSGTIETVLRYEAQADGLVVGKDMLNIPGQGSGEMTVYLTGESGLTKEQAESVTAEATNGATVETEAVEFGADVYAAAIMINADGAGLYSEFTVTISGAEGAIQHTLNCTYGKTAETVYYEDIDEYQGYRPVDPALVSEITAYFRGEDEKGLDDAAGWTVLPFDVRRSTEYSTEVVNYQDGKQQIRIVMRNTADADETTFNTFAFVDPDGILQATFMLAFKPGEGTGESGGNDEDDNEGGAQVCGVLIEGAEDRGFDINGFFTLENPKVTAYWRGLDGADGGFASEEEAMQYRVEIDSLNSASVETDVDTSYVKIENTDLYQLKIEIEILNATSSTWIDYKICKSGAMVDGFGLSVLDGDEGNDDGNDPDQGEDEEEPIQPAVPVIGQPLSGKTAEVILDGRRSYSVLFGVEEVFIYYRGEENTGMTLDEANKLTAEIVRMESLSPKATLQCDVVPMEGEENLYQLKMTMELSNVAYYSWFEVSVYDDDREIYTFELEMEAGHIAYSKEVEINGKTVRLSTAGLMGTTKVEDDATSTWPLDEYDRDEEKTSNNFNVIGAFSGDRGSYLEDVSQEEPWVYELIENIEVAEIYNDANDFSCLGTVYNEDPQMRGFDVVRKLASGFIEVMITINFKDSLQMEPVVLTQRYTTHEFETKAVREKRPIDDTVEKLNKFLEEFDYSKLEDDLYVELAPITYEGTIVIPDGSYNFDGNMHHVFLTGTKDEEGNPTTLKGTLDVRGFAGHQWGIRFVAPEKKNANETTIAVKAEAPYMGGLAVQSCEFIGYDYAVYCKGSYITPFFGNVFKDNGTAVYIDADGFAAEWGYMHNIYNSQFINNDIAIHIKSLPTNIDPYDFRISKNDFINNKTDIKSEITGDYHYFFDNYHGVFNKQGTDHTRRAPMYNHNNKYLQVYPTFDKSVAELGESDLLPARKVTGNVSKMALPLEGSTANMSIDTASLQEDRTENLTIDMLNEEDETQATWTITAPQTTNFARLRTLALSTKAEGFVPYVVVEQGLNTATVQVTDSDALTELYPMLSVQLENCSEEVNAVKVTLNGLEIPAQWDAQTHMATFAPACGGTYVITAYVSEEADPDDGEDGKDEQPTPPPMTPGTGYYPDYDEDEEAKDEPAVQSFAVICRKLNVRAGAGTEYERIGSLRRGAVVEGKLLDNGWIELVLEDGSKGYVCGQYAQSTGDDATAQGCCVGEGAVVCRRLNVRSGASTSYARIGRLKRGQTVAIVGCDGAHEWYKIVWDDAHAWVCADYIER